MTPTVAEVIALPAIAAGQPKVLSARRWEDPIRWVHVGDVADWSALLQGGELVLTTGAALRESPARYLRGLADAGALGVVVELGAAGSLPKAAAALADDLNLALVELHRDIKFVEVTEEAHRRIVAEQFEEVAFDRRVHETFTDLSMKRVSAGGIVAAAAPPVGAPGGVGGGGPPAPPRAAPRGNTSRPPPGPGGGFRAGPGRRRAGG